MCIGGVTAGLLAFLSFLAYEVFPSLLSENVVVLWKSLEKRIRLLWPTGRDIFVFTAQVEKEEDEDEGQEEKE